MKKNTLIVAIIAIFALSLTSCDGTKKDLTFEEAVTGAKNGWVLSSATSSPAYKMENGEYVTDLMNGGYLLACELDDITKFAANGALTINPGTKTCSADDKEYASTWTYNAETKILYYQIPFFYDDERENVHVLDFSKDELRVNYTYNDVEVGTKDIYTFTLIYKKK